MSVDDSGGERMVLKSVGKLCTLTKAGYTGSNERATETAATIAERRITMPFAEGRRTFGRELQRRRSPGHQFAVVLTPCRCVGCTGGHDCVVVCRLNTFNRLFGFVCLALRFWTYPAMSRYANIILQPKVGTSPLPWTRSTKMI